MKKLSFWGAVFSILSLSLALYFLVRVWDVLIPFILGLAFAYLVQPLVDRFVALGWRRDRTVLVLYVILLMVVVMAGFFLVPKLIREANGALKLIPVYAAKFNVLNDNLAAELNRTMVRLIGKRAQPISLPFRADVIAERFVTQLPESIWNVAHAGLWIFIIPFVCYFALAQGKEWMNILFNLTPSEYVESLLGLVAEVNATLGAYIRGQLLDAMCVGLLTMEGLWLLDFDQAVLISVLTAF